MEKKIDLKLSIFELIQKYPELLDVMVELGFTDITKPAMLRSVGKLMTIPKGAKMKHISMDEIKEKLAENGFTIDRIELLKSYLKRLGKGEELETIKAEFVAEFRDVDASEIMKAEQAILAEGTPLTEVQKLCDVHSALFHGATKEEKIANAEKAVDYNNRTDEYGGSLENRMRFLVEICNKAREKVN